MASGQISGTVRCEELADGPLVVSAHSEPVPTGAPAAEVVLPAGPGEFSLDVAPGRWWVHAVLDQPGIPGARAISAWAREPVELAAGQTVAGVEIVIEVPETVR
jgi:hypothetical protein